MNTADIGPLVKGVMVLIGLAVATGQYSNLEHWAKTRALEAVMWREPLPYFFKDTHGLIRHDKLGVRRFHHQAQKGDLTK